MLLAVLSPAAARQPPAPARSGQQAATVYSSMPLQGPARPQSLAVVQGARLALEEAGMRAGPLRPRDAPAYSARYGEPFPDPYAVQGYEAMRLVLDAVAAVGPRRRAVVTWLHDVRNRQSVLGTYGFDRFGDTTLRDYGLYRIRGGALQWAGAARAP